MRVRRRSAVEVSFQNTPAQICIHRVDVVGSTGDKHQLFDTTVGERSPQHCGRRQRIQTLRLIVELSFPEELQSLDTVGVEVLFAALPAASLGISAVSLTIPPRAPARM